MEFKLDDVSKRGWLQVKPQYVFWFLLLCLSSLFVDGLGAQEKKESRSFTRAITNTVPDGYLQVGNTMVYYRQTSSGIDIAGRFANQYYGSTYADRGYRLAMQVGDYGAVSVDCLNGTTNNGVTCMSSIVAQGALARICYTVTNSNVNSVRFSLGVYADVMIGNNDSAPIERRLDTFGNAYGVTMYDGNGAQLCLLFGEGLAGVVPVSDFWFGYYNTNSTSLEMVGNYREGGNYMQENGSYDSGMGWCWKDQEIPAGSTMIFTYLIGVGEVSLDPSSSFEVTPDDLEGWNDLSRPHVLILEGDYDSPAGVDGRIEYAVEDSRDWQALTDMIPSGSSYSGRLVATFDPTKSTHVIRFRIVDNVGNTTVLPSIEYPDMSYYVVSGVKNYSYTGQPIYQTNLSCELQEDWYSVQSYRNNVDAGLASFSVEGLFPYTIGRRSYTFSIEPIPLAGELILSSSSYVYNGTSFTPSWCFSDSRFSGLVLDQDYSVNYSNNRQPGNGTLTVTGVGNYTSSLSSTFFIDKAPLTSSLYRVTLPDADISYDEQPHAASISSSSGVGEALFTYRRSGSSSFLSSAPSAVGEYEVYLQISEGTLYYGAATSYVGSFAIYQFDSGEWSLLNTLRGEMVARGWATPWNTSLGVKAVGTFDGLQIERGHVVGVDFEGFNLTGEFPTTLLDFSQLKSINLSNNNLSGDLSTLLARVVAQNSSRGAAVSLLNLRGNQFSGNVGVLAEAFPALTSLNVSYNQFEELYPAISSEVVELTLSNQTMSRVIELDLAQMDADEVVADMPTLLLYDHSTGSYKSTISLLCTEAAIESFNRYSSVDFIMQLTCGNGQITTPYVSAKNAYYGRSGDVLNVFALNQQGSLVGSTFKIALHFEQGDANFINGVNVADLQATILYALEDYRTRPFNFTAADLYPDEQVNVQDVVCLVNLLLANTSSAPQRSLKSLDADDAEPDAYLYIKEGLVILNSAKEVAALDIKMSGEAVWELNQYGLLQSTSGSNVVGYSLDGTTLSIGETVIGRCAANASIRSISVADAEAQQIFVSIGEGTPTSMEGITDSSTEYTEVYDLSGRKLNGMKRGVNIVKINGRTIKVINNTNK